MRNRKKEQEERRKTLGGADPLSSRIGGKLEPGSKHMLPGQVLDTSSGGKQFIPDEPLPGFDRLAGQDEAPKGENKAEEIPTDVPLNPSSLDVTGKTALGKASSASIALGGPTQDPAFQGVMEAMKKNNLTPQQVTEDPVLQNALMLGLNERDLRVLGEGQANVGGFAQFVEGLPFNIGNRKVLGFSLSTIAPGSPQGKVDEAVELLTLASTTATNALSNADTDPINRRAWIQQANDAKEAILDLESRIKLLSIQSPEVQGNPNKKQELETKINNIKISLPELFPI